MFKNKFFILVILFVFSSNTIFSQCAMCKAVVESGDVSLAKGVNNGITYLMAFPYILIAGLFYTLYRYKKKAKI